jgi:hypothetical protein
VCLFQVVLCGLIWWSAWVRALEIGLGDGGGVAGEPRSQHMGMGGTGGVQMGGHGRSACLVRQVG